MIVYPMSKEETLGILLDYFRKQDFHKMLRIEEGMEKKIWLI